MLKQLVCVVCASLLVSSCSGPTPRDPNSPDNGSLTAIRSALEPYDLQGSTRTALLDLDVWAARHEDDLEAQKLWADTVLDLIVFERVATLINEPAGQDARTLLDELNRQRTEDGDERSLPQQVIARYEVARADAETVSLAQEILDFDLEGSEAIREFRRFRSATAHGSRLRLMLVSLFYQFADHWMVPVPEGDEVEQRLLSNLSWICTDLDGSVENIQQLAAFCGYWCIDYQPPPPPPKGETRDSEELLEGDAPLGEGGEVSEPTPRPSLAELYPGPWDPTPGDIGFELLQECGANYFRLPQEPGVALLNERNFVDLVLLEFVSELVSEIESDLLDDEALTVLSSPLLSTFTMRFLAAPVPQELTAGALQYDPRLRLPVRSGEGATPLEQSPLRILSVFAGGVYVSLSPRLTLRANDLGHYEVSYFEGEAGFHYPGRELFPSARLNRIQGALVEDGRVPLVSQGLGELDEYLVELGWEANRGERPDVLVLIDGTAQLHSLQPLLSSVNADHNAVLGLRDAAGALCSAPLSLVDNAEEPSDMHRLVLRLGEIHYYGPGAQDASIEIGLEERQPL
ncbi:MAG: hypothetical protein KC561_06085, partial [Myxococcales bacterium]|nr:hypothetical protein [Myxococcales bacterium]